MARARGFLSEDFDSLEEQFQGFRGPLTVSIVGPVSWAASVEGPGGEKLIRDHGALRDISIALSLVIAGLTVDFSRRLPGAVLTVQIDEPLVMSATTGEIPTASALRTYVALDRQFVAALWSPIFIEAAAMGVGYGINASGGHVSLSDPYVSLLRAASVTRFYAMETAKEQGEVIESGAETVWIASQRLTGLDLARDIAARIGSLGFELTDFTPTALVVPSEANMVDDWAKARRAWNRTQGAVDLLNDPDRLMSC
jgi:hypothetical protein